MPLIFLVLAMFVQAPVAVVTGVVIDAQAGHPVAGARVLLARTDGPLLASVTVKTDDQGRFSFAGVAAGSYRAIAVHDDYLRGEARMPIHIADGSSAGNLSIALVPTGVISGRVVNEFGDPARRIYVRAWQGPTMAAESRTDDLGAFRLFGLAAGAYVVTAERYLPPRVEGERYIVPTPPCPDCRGEGQGMMSIATSTAVGGFIDPRALNPSERSPAVYYPGTTVPAEARPIDVSPGARIINIDLQLVTVRAP
jgi:hypothetical protein